MKVRFASMGLRALKEESGQVFAVTGMGALLLVGLAGLSIEVGHGYYALELLQASTDEATIAAASGLPSSTQAQTNAQNYSSEVAEQNKLNILQNIQLQVTPFCSTTVSTNLNVPCQAASGSTNVYNAVQVTQKATTGLWIGTMFGVPLFNLEAIGTAAMAGGNYTPYNIAVIMDTTASMGDADSTGQCSGTQESCALAGLRVLLQDAYPCGAGQTCTSGTSTPDDDVALFVFPSVTSGSTTNDTTCPTSAPSVLQYTVPVSTGTDEIIPFGSGTTYKTSDTSTSLRSGDSLVNAAGGPTDNCTGLYPKGGAGTYYAQAIYQAGAALAAEQTARPGTQNILILLSDGNATSTPAYTSTYNPLTKVTTWSLSGGDFVSNPTGALNGLLHGLSTNSPYIYSYPSAVGECGQAVEAANNVATAASVTINGSTVTLNNTSTGTYTKVYTVAYGSPNYSGSGNCASDQVLSGNTSTGCTVAPCTITLTTGGGSWPTPTAAEGSITAYSPCAAMAAMASSPNYFFSDDSDNCKADTVPNAGITSLTQVFGKIINSLSSPKLLPLGTT